MRAARSAQADALGGPQYNAVLLAEVDQGVRAVNLLPRKEQPVVQVHGVFAVMSAVDLQGEALAQRCFGRDAHLVVSRGQASRALHGERVGADGFAAGVDDFGDQRRIDGVEAYGALPPRCVTGPEQRGAAGEKQRHDSRRGGQRDAAPMLTHPAPRRFNRAGARARIGRPSRKARRSSASS